MTRARLLMVCIAIVAGAGASAQWAFARGAAADDEGTIQIVAGLFPEELTNRERQSLLIDDADQCQVNRDELFVTHRQRGFTRTHHHAQVARTCVDHIRGDLQDADRFQLFVQGLDDQQLHPLCAGIFDRADRSASHSAE